MKRNLTKVFLSLFSIVAVLTIVGTFMCAKAVKSGGIAACKFEPTKATTSEIVEFKNDDLKDAEYSDILNINTEKVNKDDVDIDTEIMDTNTNSDVVDGENFEEVPPTEGTPVIEDTESDIEDTESAAPSGSESKIENDAVQEPVANKEPLRLTGGYASVDRSAYTVEESELLDIIFGKIKEYQTNPEIRGEKIPLNGMFDYESYCKVSSYFYVYYGQKRAVDETFDLVNATREDGYLQLRYDDIEVFEAERQANQAKIDAILSTFSSGSEEHVLKQIAEYLASNIVYTDGYYDLSSALGGKSVCNGYALAFNAMANRAGIKSDMCIGKAGGEYHAWNRVTLSDGSYRFYDITFYDSNGNNKYLYSKTSFHGEYLINDYTSCWFDR